MTWAWEQAVRGNEKLVLLALADHADDAGVCWPGVRRVAHKTGIHYGTVQRIVVRLRGAGLLEVLESGKAEGTSNLYRLTVPAPVDSHPERSGGSRAMREGSRVATREGVARNSARPIGTVNESSRTAPAAKKGPPHPYGACPDGGSCTECLAWIEAHVVAQ